VLVEIACRRAGEPEPLDAGGVPRVDARADEVVVGELERLAQRGEAVGLPANEVRHGQPGGLCRLDVLQRVVVRSALEADVVASQPAMPREHVGLHELERVPEVWIAVHVRDRGGDVEASLAHRWLPFWPVGAGYR
jgi:hypothetical protein